MAPLSPTVARWELMLRIRRRRRQFDVGAPTIAKELGFTLSYWSKVEKERVLAEDKLERLMELLEFDPAERDRMRELREAAKRRGWWAEYANLLPEEVARLYGLEYGATSVRTYESLMIPGLLQTEDYARALIGNDAARIRRVEVERLVELRIRRQARLDGDAPLQLTAIVHEAALTQQIGGRDVLRGQLRHLGDVLDRHPETVDLRIVPFDAVGGALLGGATFHLLGFDSPLLPDIAWSETLIQYALIEDSEPVRHLSTMFEHARAEHALPPADSRELLERRIEAL
ncbi:DUF5753 domain-containing protein [Nocardia cyriacigeorgica]|jgi:hypothetical protein|uniref:DUF5753 domain-containing protein n=1 Tax=Nocardia cyriacigeorgica TaxID=135487 RepID=UPI0005613C19|nr:DUF5753 domain-containing protein [Nocardia cyriacigeorgica]AVH21903.1 transcriptional regulator [Nocardia cyriacigeorgica]MBF6321419.1 helix-turn-helix domain-containing protein [Nocardia cyriacigeorgica]MBF6494905.1 helix-turn-helix domain-containing protein [Nocardia cyriacigeorgica]PPJ09699.1 transcriptional regulator [Nocardia cyriacigeorgica]TLF57259.1 transcriptional regulator [Nocardia cyriacigeorgica]